MVSDVGTGIQRATKRVEEAEVVVGKWELKVQELEAELGKRKPKLVNARLQAEFDRQQLPLLRAKMNLGKARAEADEAGMALEASRLNEERSIEALRARGTGNENVPPPPGELVPMKNRSLAEQKAKGRKAEPPDPTHRARLIREWSKYKRQTEAAFKRFAKEENKAETPFEAGAGGATQATGAGYDAAKADKLYQEYLDAKQLMDDEQVWIDMYDQRIPGGRKPFLERPTDLKRPDEVTAELTAAEHRDIEKRVFGGTPRVELTPKPIPKAITVELKEARTLASKVETVEVGARERLDKLKRDIAKRVEAKLDKSLTTAEKAKLANAEASIKKATEAADAARERLAAAHSAWEEATYAEKELTGKRMTKAGGTFKVTTPGARPLEEGTPATRYTVRQLPEKSTKFPKNWAGQWAITSVDDPGDVLRVFRYEGAAHSYLTEYERVYREATGMPPSEATLAAQAAAKETRQDVLGVPPKLEPVPEAGPEMLPQANLYARMELDHYAGPVDPSFRDANGNPFPAPYPIELGYDSFEYLAEKALLEEQKRTQTGIFAPAPRRLPGEHRTPMESGQYATQQTKSALMALEKRNRAQARREQQRGMVIGKHKAAVNRSMTEMNRTYAEARGLKAGLKPALVKVEMGGDATGLTALRVPGLEGHMMPDYMASEWHSMLDAHGPGDLHAQYRKFVLGPWSGGHAVLARVPHPQRLRWLVRTTTSAG